MTATTTVPVRSASLLRRLLGFARVSVKGSEIDETGALVIDIRLFGRARCPGCGRKAPGYDRRETRYWRHQDVVGHRCFLRASLRRVECKRCEAVRVEAVTWAAPGSDFTLAFEDLVAWLAQGCDKTMVARLMRVAWLTVGTIIARVVARVRPPVDLTQLQAIGVDELSYRKGHRYLTLVTDLATSRVIWAAEGKSAETLAGFFRWIGPEVCAQISWVTMDMSGAYKKAVEDHLPKARIVFDRFHVMLLVSDAVDETRRREWRKRQGTAEGEATKGLRWILLKAPERLDALEKARLASLIEINRSIYRGYMLKEGFADIFRGLPLRRSAEKQMREWLGWASRSKLPAFVKVARTIRNHLDGILAYFETGYTNGLAEGMNAKARLATRRAYGFHAAEAVVAMIELCCTGIHIPLPHVNTAA